MPSLRDFIKYRLPALHAKLLPLYWKALRPTVKPVMERQLTRALQRAHRHPELKEQATALAAEVDAGLSSRDLYAGLSRRLADNYVYVGFSAMKCIREGLAAAGLEEPSNILDLPCGHGRVLRFLRAAFPAAGITACDLDSDMVDFCRDTFGVRGAYSLDSPEQLDLGETYDLIWCGSLLTHLAIERWHEFIGLFRRHLRPGGVMIFTTHGERAAQRIRKRVSNYRLSREGLDILLDGYETRGHGYSHYPRSSEYYGISISKCSHVEESVSRFPDLEMVKIIEHGWNNHQDVYACRLVVGEGAEIKEPQPHDRSTPKAETEPAAPVNHTRVS